MIDLGAGDWTLAVTRAGAFDGPPEGELPDAVPAQVPGTVAGALAQAGLFDPENPHPLHGSDVWYETRFDTEPGRYLLRFEGLATVAEVYLNGARILETRNMFRSFEVAADLSRRNRLQICLRALDPHLGAKGPRARWKPQLATSQGLRLVRTTLLGHMPGWCPEIHAVGPYRPVTLTPLDAPRITERRIHADLAPDGSAHLGVMVRLENTDGVPVLECAGASAAMTRQEDGSYSATLRPDAAPWMPHTHGAPVLHEITLAAGERTFDLGRTGFRRIEVDHGVDGTGFGLTINGVPVFCRGAVWTPADLTCLAGDENTLRPLLTLARDAGMNMLRIGGTMVYESRAFFELCDELGLLVFQDFQFANYDYPVKDEAFVGEVRAEVRDQLLTSMGCPSLAVLCGGSEIYQQGAMMGLPEERWKGPLCEEILAGLSADLRPDVPYAPNSPHGGVLPFSADAGIAHYYGVGAYLRPLDDARRSGVRFAGECLAFSNIPERRSLEEGLDARPGHDPRWKARVPRDRGAGWDFEDVRDHYLKSLYGIDPAALRYGDPERYLDLGRAVTGEVMERTFAEWRRPASPCRGALVWTFRDLAMGAGWGLIDASGRPKPAWHALKRAFRPLQLALTDEGTNGLAIHLINETGTGRQLFVSLACLRDGKLPVVSGRQELALPARDGLSLNAVDLIGAFFDVTYAYRFGPKSHDVTVVRLEDADSGELLAEAHHLVDDTAFWPHGDAPDVRLEQGGDGAHVLQLEASRFLRAVTIDVPGYLPDDNGFSLAPGLAKRVALAAEPGAPERPQGAVTALNLSGRATF